LGQSAQADFAWISREFIRQAATRGLLLIP
jgi:hypothetical protein